MDDQQNLLDYETIKGAVAEEKWTTERILKHYDFYLNKPITVKERQSDGSVKCYVDEHLKQSIALKLLEKRILFDAGYSDIFLSNAEKMGIDLRGLTHIVLSHGHNDHSRGLQFLFARFELSHVKLIAHPDCFLPKYDDIEYIGAPYSNAEVSHKANYIPCCVPYKISENLIWLGEIPRRNDFEIAQSIGKQKKSGQLEADYVMDDTALIYRNSDGYYFWNC